MKSTKIFASNVNGMIGQQKISARFIQFLLFGCLFLCMFSLSNSSNPSSSSSSPTTFYSEQKDNEEQFTAQNGADEQENNKIEEEEVGANMQAEIVENEDNCDVHHNQGLHGRQIAKSKLKYENLSFDGKNLRTLPRYVQPSTTKYASRLQVILNPP